MIKRNEAQAKIDAALGVKGKEMYQLNDCRLFKVIHKTIFVDEVVLTEYINEKKVIVEAQKAFHAKWPKK